MTREDIKYRMKRLARKFCKRNKVYEEFDSSVGKLVEKAYISAYLLCLHENQHNEEKPQCSDQCEHCISIDEGDFMCDIFQDVSIVNWKPFLCACSKKRRLNKC